LRLRLPLKGAILRTGATVFNKSSRAMPVSFGFHPAFRWPLPYGVHDNATKSDSKNRNPHQFTD
jgi:galactose mutarotase-like enzyme